MRIIRGKRFDSVSNTRIHVGEPTPVTAMMMVVVMVVVVVVTTTQYPPAWGRGRSTPSS